MTYVTAGFPLAEDTPDIMLGMEAGGAGKLTPLTQLRQALMLEARCHRAGHALHRSNCRRSYNPESEYCMLNLPIQASRALFR